MALTSPQFLLFVLAVVLAFHAGPSMGYRRAVLTIANVIFLASFVSSWVALVPLAGFLLVGYLALHIGRRPAASAIAIAFIVVLFAYLKRYAFLDVLPGLPLVYLGVGLSYILFRILQLVIDHSADSSLPLPSPRAYFDFTCNFLTFVSGPIQRSGDFATDQDRLCRPVDANLAYRAFARLVLGYFKVAALSAIANYVFANVSAPLLAPAHPSGLVRLALDYTLAVASFTAYLYYNFAGYMDIVIGIGWLFGEELPENFDHPFRARNLFEFWARWHMTLSEWFKTYLFNPLLGAFASRVTHAAAMPYLGVLTFFITFFVMGVWHGSTLVFVIYGLVMGAGVSLNKVWQLFCTARLGKKRYRVVGEHWLYAGVARGITTAFFSIAVTALWVDFAQLESLIKRLGLVGFGLSFVGLVLAAGFALPVGDLVGSRFTALRERVMRAAAAPLSRQVALGAEVLLILVVTSFFHKAPEFVYKAF